jgi:predicted phage terminase large subunit-like protein
VAVADQPSLEQKLLQARRLSPTDIAPYAWLTHRDDRERRISMAPHHQVLAAHLQDQARFPYLICVMPPGYSKLLSDDTPMLTTCGWTTHGRLRVGDEVFAPDGTPVKVQATIPWPTRERERVVFDDGTSIVADANHEWDVLCDRERYRYDGYVDGKMQRSTKRIWERLETRDLLVGQRRPPAIPVAQPVQFPDADLPIDPYILGLWLGNGTTKSGRITFNIRDVEHYRWLDGNMRERPHRGTASITVRGLVGDLRAAGLLGHKHIPAIYQIASVNQRRRLLQGLIDTDGDVHITSGQCAYATTLPELRDGVRLLLASLGFKPTVCESRAMLNGVDHGPYWRLLFTADSASECCTVPYKASRLRATITERARRRFVVDVQHVGEYPGQCIQVQGGVYLAGEQLVATHNSTLGSWIYPAWKLGHRHGNLRIGLISNTATQAEGFSRAVQQTVMSETYANTFGDVTPDPNRRWTTKEMFFTNTPSGPNPGLTAMGMDGPILGRRFDEIILDDPSTWDQARSEVTMEGQRAKVTNTIIQRFPASSRPPGGDRRTRMVVLMTRFGERDLFPLFVDDLNFHVLHMPALGYWDRIVKCTQCGQSAQGRNPCSHDQRNMEVEWGEMALWPSAQSREDLVKLRENDELVFQLIYQGDTSVLKGNIYDPNWIQRGELPSSFDRVIMGVDTAGGRDAARGDYTAIVTLGFRGDQVWVIDAYRDRLPAPRQEDAIVEKFETWRDMGWMPEAIAIEDVNEGGAIIQHLNVSHRLPIIPVKPRGDKAFRAISFSNAYRAGRVWHPSGERWTRAFEAELLAFPTGPRDDLNDAAVHAFNVSAPDGGARLRVLG